MRISSQGGAAKKAHHHSTHILPQNAFVIQIDRGLPGGHSFPKSDASTCVSSIDKRQFDQGEWAWFIQYSMGADWPATTSTQTLPQYTIYTMVILPPCHHSGVVLWGLIIRQQGIFFLAPSAFRFKHSNSMGACSSTTSYKPNHHSCPLHHIKLWGLDFLIYFTKKTTPKSLFINIEHYKTICFLWGLYGYFCSLILGTIFPRCS
jgi:hypothetical protein